ncbi:hypothetical protein Leryth_013718 [Lithospermum erythrorhizon]|nr:hypothetical protein Leryth_013718 [Lithospermum erythrorhizon]
MSSSTDNNPNSKDTEMMSVLERQRSIYAGLYHQQQSMQNNISNIQTPLHQLSLPVNGNNGLLNEHFHNFAAFGGENYGISCSDMSKNSLETENFMVPTVSNSSSAPIRNLVAQDSIKACKEKPISAKKRKAEEFKNLWGFSGDDKSDYIHVRARRGQATDSHSLAERARREKISKKMKYLQDLVPGCNKVTGKAGMLDEIINYVQSLQKQVEFLSLKLSCASRLDFNI